MGSIEVPHSFLVANITDNCILGMDFMMKHNVKVDIGEHVMKCKNVEIPLVIGTGNHKAFRITVSHNESIPPLSDTVIWTDIKESKGDNSIYLIEQLADPIRNVLVGKTLVKDSRNGRLPIRLLNISNNEVQLKTGDAIGTCEPVSEILRLSSTECNDKSVVNDAIYDQLLSNCTLEKSEFNKARKLLHEFVDIFSTRDGDFGRTGLVQHRIDTGDSKPIRQPPRRLPLAKQTEAAAMIDKMKKEGVIEESESPWTSPIVLVRKKDGSTRFCVDYRRLNDVTRKDSYPLPRIDDTLDTLSGSQWFSTLDLRSGYWQVEIHPEDREKTAFSMGTGLWQFKVMPFGLCNAPATFERLMECVLKGLTWSSCLVYLDDIIVVGRNFDEHLNNLKEVFKRLKNANLKLSPEKCNLFREEVKYLGHVVSSRGVSTDPEKIEAVRNWPTPKDKHQLRSFLGLATYYRRFVHGFADIAKSLHQLTEKGKQFIWSEQCEKSFQELKTRLSSAPILRYPDANKMFILDTDASNVGIGAVLSQLEGSQELPVAYFSKLLSKPERNYCVTRKELLAVVKSVKNFHKYLYGRKFILRTDHAALKWLLQFKNPEGQVARWIEQLQAYDFEIQHRKGKIHGNADALSRRPCKIDCKHCIRQEEREVVESVFGVKLEAVKGWNITELREAQKNDPDIGLMLTWKETNIRPEWKDVSDKSEITKSYWAQWNSLVVDDGILKRKWEAPDGKSYRLQLLIPSGKVTEVLAEVHNGASGGHLGVNKTLSKVRERFYWLNMRADIEDWCRRCADCAGSKGPQRKTKGKMHLYNVGVPFERIAMDIAGPFPVTKDGNRYILVIMDYFTKWPEVFALPNQEATTVADCLVSQWISRFGVPLEMHSDQGRNFESTIFQEVAKVLGIKKTRTTPLHPQSDGMVERFNKTIMEHLRKVVEGHQQEWDKHIPLFLLAYRSAPHNGTGYSPAQLMFGRNLRLPVDLAFGMPPDTPKELTDYAADIRRELVELHENARKNLKVVSERMKTRYDKMANSSGFQVNDLVWLYNPQRRKGYSPKLQRSWEGPYRIVTRINDVIYRIQKGVKGKFKIVHLDRLAPYLDSGGVETDVNRDDQH